MKTRKRVATLFILGALLLSTVTPVLGAPNLEEVECPVITDIDVDIGECQVDPTDGQLKRKVTFTPTVTGPDPTAYQWKFGDGTTKFGTGPPGLEEHLYEAKPDQAPQLCIDGPDPCPQTCQEVPLSEFDTFEPCADFTAFIEYEVTDCLEVTFTGSAEEGTEPYTFDWDFGDGDTATGETVTHTYEAAGTYTVTLTVTDSAEETATTEETLTLGGLEASASADPRLAEPGEEIAFTGSATGGEEPYTFEWDFGDGDTGEGVTATHVYTETNIYDVTLTVTDVNGCTAEDTVRVAVGEPSAHIISNLIAAFFILPPEHIDALRQDGWGYGEIAKAYIAAQLSGEDPAAIIELRQDGSGWGEIFKDTVGFAGLHGYNLGLIVSGRKVPAPIQNLADFCQMEVEELTELLQETGAKFSTVRMACRLAQEVDSEEVTLQEIIEMRQEGMTWREIKEALGLVPERGPKEQGSQGQGQAHGKGKDKGPKH